MWNLKFIRSRTQSRYQSVWKSKSSNMERNDNVMIVGNEYGLFALNQIPLTGLIFILLIGQILNITLTKILDIILRTIINRTEDNQSRQIFNIIRINIKTISLIIGMIFHKILLYHGIPIESWFWTFLAKYTNKNNVALPELTCWFHLTDQHWRLLLHRRLWRPPILFPLPY